MKNSIKNFPIQPIDDIGGVLRFRKNALVDYLLEKGGIDLNQLSIQFHSDEFYKDWEQFAQLIGYSLSGFGGLSYVSDDTYETAAKMVDDSNRSEQEMRIEMLEEKLEKVRTALKGLVPELFSIHPDDL